MNHNVPLFDLNYDKKEEQAVLATLRSKWISTGPKCAELEDIFAKMLGCKYTLSLTNCTSALHLAMKILNIGEGDEVITPSLTFVATVNAIRYVNAIPVFCDIKSYEDLTIDSGHIKQLITPKTKAIMVMHYAGFPCDMDEILMLAKENNLKVIEDACHGPLSEYKGKKLGTIGDIGCFSFFSNKNISTGEGGMLVTDNEEIYQKAKLLRSHGMTTLSYERSKGHSTGYDVVELGYNYRMDDIRATLGIAQLEKLQGDLMKRQDVRNQYETCLRDIENIIVPFDGYKGFVSNYIFPIVLRNSDAKKRNRVREQLQKKGIQTSVHYPAVHLFKIYEGVGVSLPKTEYVSSNGITMPFYANLSGKTVDYVVNSIKETIV